MKSIRVSISKYHIYMFCNSIWHLVTITYLWSPSVTVYHCANLYTTHESYPLLLSQAISRFFNFTSGDHRQSLSPAKHNRIYVLTATHPHANYEDYPCFLPWYVVFKSFPAFQLWRVLNWPEAPHKNNWILPLFYSKPAYKEWKYSHFANLRYRFHKGFGFYLWLSQMISDFNEKRYTISSSSYV